MAAARLHVGTSGWSYAHWGKGRFYPKGLRQGEWLNRDAKSIDGWLSAGREVWAYFNNDAEAHAVANARQLIELLNEYG